VAYVAVDHSLFSSDGFLRIHSGGAPGLARMTEMGSLANSSASETTESGAESCLWPVEQKARGMSKLRVFSGRDNL
jgi:hypothetical protein